MSEKKSLGEWTKKELLALPYREWNQPAEYDTVLILSTGKKHKSGWAAVAIIGVKAGIPVEIASACSDDIEWKLPSPVSYSSFSIGQMRMDCAVKSGAMQAWQRGVKFRVGIALSSIDIEVIPQVKEPA